MENIEELIAASLKGDQAAFNKLYKYAFPTVEKECLKILHNQQDAKDAEQETFLTIWSKLDTIKNPKSFLGWCRTIAHNTSVNLISKHDRKAGQDELRPPETDEQYAGMDLVESTAISPEEEAERKMTKEYLQKAVDNIPATRLMCLSMYEKQGYSYAEISKELSIPLGTVKSNIHYAKTALKKEIRKLEKEEHIQIFGFTLVPVNGRMEVRLQQPENGGFVQAAETSSMQDEVWNVVSKQISKQAARAGLWKKIFAIAVAVIIIAAGVVFAINRAGHANFQTRRFSTTVSESARETARESPRSAVNPQQAAQPANQNAESRAAQQQTQTPSTTVQTTTEREWEENNF